MSIQSVVVAARNLDEAVNALAVLVQERDAINARRAVLANEIAAAQAVVQTRKAELKAEADTI